MSDAIGAPQDSAPHGRVLILLIVVVTALVYARVLGHDHVSVDDRTYVFENEPVLRGITADGVRWAFQSGEASNWHPLTWISHMLDIQLFGPERPGLHHATSVVLHLLNSWLLYLLVFRLSGRVNRALFIAAIFALHPLHIESVAWIAERKDVLSTFFWLCSLIAYERYARSGRWLSYGVSLLLMGLGLLSKSMLVTAPFVCLLLDYWPLRRFGRRAVVEKIPMFLLIAAVALVTYLVQDAGGAVNRLPFAHRLATALVAYSRYMGKMFWPSGLSVLYPNYEGMWSIVQIVGAASIIVLVTAAVLRWRETRALSVGWFWYLGTLVPVIGLVQVGHQSMADRYTYFPMVGFTIAVVWAFEKLRGGRGGATVGWGIALAICLALGLRTAAHLPVWANSERLYLHALSVTRQNRVMHNNLAAWYFRQEEFEASIRQCRAALAIDPTYMRCRELYIFALQGAGRYEEAIEATAEFAELQPDDHELLFELGRLQENYAGPAEAERSYMRYLEYTPESAEGWNSLGRVRRELGNLVGASDAFGRAAAIAPDFRDAHWNAAACLVELGRSVEAVEVLREYLLDHVFDQETRRMLEQLQAAQAVDTPQAP